VNDVTGGADVEDDWEEEEDAEDVTLLIALVEPAGANEVDSDEDDDDEDEELLDKEVDV
jgi:hypothetical protein